MVSIDKARHFVHANGTLWERALWDYLFDGGSLDRVHQCLLCYKNADGGWGHGLERDLKAPASNPLMLEFLLTVGRDTGVPLVGTFWTVRRSGWKAYSARMACSNRRPACSTTRTRRGGNRLQIGAPDSITGHLTKLGLCPPAVQERTRALGHGEPRPGADPRQRVALHGLPRVRLLHERG